MVLLSFLLAGPVFTKVGFCYQGKGLETYLVVHEQEKRGPKCNHEEKKEKQNLKKTANTEPEFFFVQIKAALTLDQLKFCAWIPVVNSYILAVARGTGLAFRLPFPTCMNMTAFGGHVSAL